MWLEMHYFCFDPHVCPPVPTCMTVKKQLLLTLCSDALISTTFCSIKKKFNIRILEFQMVNQVSESSALCYQVINKVFCLPFQPLSVSWSQMVSLHLPNGISYSVCVGNKSLFAPFPLQNFENFKHSPFGKLSMGPLSKA